MHRLVDECRHPPQPFAAADAVEEVAEDRDAVGRVAYLGMKLQTVDRPAEVSDGRDRAGVRRGQREEVAADRLDLVAVAHPDGDFRRHPCEESFGFVDAAGLPPELARLARFDLAAEYLTGELHPVA